MPADHSCAFAPGRVNLIGEHTDYNEGLALPFAIAEGVTVRAEAQSPGSAGAQRIEAHASDLGERDDFALAHVTPAVGWRAFVRGTVAELGRARYPLVGAHLCISADVPAGAGLSSSAALEVALCLALIVLCGQPPPDDAVELARLCTRVENRWVGAQTGLLDQLASLCGAPDSALCIDFRTLHVQPVPLALADWRLVVLDSGERHQLASSGYNQRRAECAQASQLLGVKSLRDATAAAAERLPEPLRQRAEHVIDENQRVRDAVAALHAHDLPALASLLNASHESLRDLYEVSTAAVEATRERLLGAGARGARLIGGGFGGSVLGLLEPGVSPPAGAREVRPGPGAHLVE
ncbi:MAG TPA: galactokinase family protein [Solirubrobacteraceae bacterium]|nr:galactokinase family protein [Solirubrobacteraceae bacterium]